MSIALRLVPCAALVAVAIACSSSAALADSSSSTPITVTVDNQQVQFPGTQPTEVHGSVLVPLRGVFEALHANVDYDPSTQTITATRGSRTVVVPIGSMSATIDGQSQPLSQPAQIVNGTTMVPLRFVAEALGDYVDWSGDTNTVTIVRETHVAFAHRGPSDFAEAGTNIVSGTLRRIIVGSDSSQIVVRSNGQDQSITLSQSATIQRGTDRDSLSTSSLSDLQPGDHVWVRENDHGHAANITAIIGAAGQ